MLFTLLLPIILKDVAFLQFLVFLQHAVNQFFHCLSTRTIISRFSFFKVATTSFLIPPSMMLLSDTDKQWLSMAIIFSEYVFTRVVGAVSFNKLMSVLLFQART